MLATLAASSILVFAQAGNEVLPVGADISFKAHTLAGAEMSAASLRGKPTLIVLWGPWNQKSYRAVEAADRMRDKYGAKLRVVALTCWDTARNTESFSQTYPKLHVEYWVDPAERDTDNSIAAKVFKTKRFPTIYVLDSSGKVVGGYVGFKPDDDLSKLIDRAS